MLSVVIPAHNESGCIAGTVGELCRALDAEGIDHEVLVIDDHSTDTTCRAVCSLAGEWPAVRCYRNSGPRGFGTAVRCGIAMATGTYVALFMADCSDSPGDLVRYYRTIHDNGYDAVFGSRFSAGGRVYGYPLPKLILNRAANWVIRLAFRIDYDDVTNAFKIYRRDTLMGLRPYLSPHFNITAELPLKVIVRGYSYTWIPNAWHNRGTGQSKFDLREMGSRYLFILAYCLIEKYFSKGDFEKRVHSGGDGIRNTEDPPG